MIRTVLHEPDPKLRIVSQPVARERIVSPDMPALIKDLLDTMEEENGIGIAAPQIGVHERIIIAELDGEPHAFFNPEITERSFKTVDSEEGCLSVPGKWGVVKRHRTVTVTALDAKGESVTIKADGLHAIIFQHEIDHLDGILFIDRAEKMSKASKM